MIFRTLLFIIIGYLVLQALYSGYFLFVGRSLKTDTFADVLTLGDKKNPPLKLFISGDSVAEGVGATTFNTSVAGRIADYYAEDYQVFFENQAVSGAKIGDVLKMPIPQEKQDVIVLIVSSNDLFRFTPIEKFRQQTEAVLERYSPLAEKVIIVGPGRVFDGEALPYPLRLLYHKRAPMYSQILTEITKKYANVIYVNPSAIDFDTKLADATTAKDKFHPNDSGHNWWFKVIKPHL